MSLSISRMAAGVSLAFAISSTFAQNSQQSTVIENTAALQVSQVQCGYKINYEMLGLALSAANLRTGDLLRGGKYWENVELNQGRVRRLIATETGRASFCRNVRRDLSAMFD